MVVRLVGCALGFCLVLPGWQAGGQRPGQVPTGVDEASGMAAAPLEAAGSIFRGGGWGADLYRDLRASSVGDVVTILVAERAAASAAGTTKSSRNSSASAGVGALAGPTKVGGALSSLARFGGTSQLEGQGGTSRETVFSTTLAAVVKEVLPGGILVVEGTKTVQVNSERQEIVVRGLVRPHDLSPGNVVRSERLANLEVRINGKGVVGDAVRRPFFLYRLLMGLLPF